MTDSPEQRNRWAQAEPVLDSELALVARHTSNAVIIIGEDLRIRWVNEGFTAISGFSLQDALGHRPGELLANPKADPAAMAELARAMAAGQPCRVELLNRAKDGQDYWVDINLQPMRDAQGALRGFLEVDSDISERKQAETQLRASERRLREVFELAPLPLSIKDGAGRFLLINAAGANQLYGMQPEDMIGKTTGECGMAAAYVDVISRAEQEARRTGKMVETSATSFVDPQGRRRWSITRRVPFHFSDEHSQALLSVLIEVTDLKNAEEQLRRALSLLEATLESTADGIVASGLDLRILLYNQRVLDIWGFSEDAIRTGDTRHFLELASQQHSDPQAYVARVEAIWAQPTRESFDQIHLIDGRVIERYSRPLMLEGAVAGRVTSMRDVTERSRAEAARLELQDQLREAQKMHAIGTLAGGIAHDFNNIIAATLGNLVLARQDIEAGRAAQALQSLGEIERASIRARSLVQQILAFSRRQPVERRRAALAPVLQEVGRFLRTTLPARLRLSIHCDPQAPLVLADITQIEQVLLNLATNAMQALGGEAGHIELRLDALRPDAALAQAQPALAGLLARHPGPLARLQVIDDGPGMDQATMQRAFEPFFTTKPVGEGTGLGLSVVHGIVQTHEGEIVLESAPGQGTTFSIYLPGAPESVQEPDRFQAGFGQAGSGQAGAGAAAPTGQRRRVLYLDDDEAMVFLVERLLERMGLRVSAHDNQREALQALQADPESFDLVVSDYNMPGLSGLDVARQVHEIRADLPVVLVSGFIDETLTAKAKEAGVLEVIFKATDVEVFCAAIQNHLAGAHSPVTPAKAGVQAPATIIAARSGFRPSPE